MAFVEWKSSFSVGVTEIDNQHKRLIEIINQLHDTMKAGATPAALSKIVQELVDYTRFHFTHEEKMLERAGYSELTEHKRVHRAMIAQVENFRNQVGSGAATTPLKLMAFLKDWLSKHILETDMRYSKTLAPQKVA